MFGSTDLVYCYDGSFEGFLCCIFESYTKKETPMAIYPSDGAQKSLYSEKWIETVSENAERVYLSFTTKMSNEVSELIRLGFLTCAHDKEMLLYHFIKLGYQYGASVADNLADDTVNTLHKAVRHLTREAHLFKGFVRFSINGVTMSAIIEPKNYVLPIISDHFTSRFKNEVFLIYDKTHKMALVYRPFESAIVHLEDFSLPESTAEEEAYRALWKRFYDTIAIEGRYNPKCRMSHMPKRYWGNMTEHTQILPKNNQAKVDDKKVSSKSLEINNLLL